MRSVGREFQIGTERLAKKHFLVSIVIVSEGRHTVGVAKQYAAVTIWDVGVKFVISHLCSKLSSLRSKHIPFEQLEGTLN